MHGAAAFLQDRFPSATPTFSSPDPLPTLSVPPGAPTHGTFHQVGRAAHKAFWVVFAVMIISAVSYGVMMTRVPRQSRLLHHLAIGVAVISAVSYYAMATEVGSVWILAPWRNWLSFHETPLPRFIETLITTPIVLFSLSLISGMSMFSSILVVLADVFMFTTLIIGGYSHHGCTRTPFHGVNHHCLNLQRSSWGFYAMACLSFLWIAYTLLLEGRRAAYARSTKAGHMFTGLTAWTLLFFAGYFIILALGPYTYRIATGSELVAWAVLDVFAKADTMFMILIGVVWYAPAAMPVLSDAWIEPTGPGYIALPADET